MSQEQVIETPVEAQDEPEKEEDEKLEEIEEDAMEIEEEETPEPSEDVTEPAEVVEVVEEIFSDEQIEKSRIQKESFLEMFRIAPRLRDVLPDLRNFVNHPDVIASDKKEVDDLVQTKIQEEKARKKAEKVAKQSKEAEGKTPVDLADAIKSVTGIDLAGILQKIPNLQQQQQNAAVVPISTAMPPPPPMPPVPNFAPPLTLGTTTISSINYGKAGFDTSHPHEIPVDLRPFKPDQVAPIPDELRTETIFKPDQVAPIPEELRNLNSNSGPLPIPSDFLGGDSQNEDPAGLSIRSKISVPPIRKTLLLAGARAGRRSERVEIEKKKMEDETKKKKQAELDKKDPIGAINRNLPEGIEPLPSFELEKRRRGGERRDRERRDRDHERNRDREWTRREASGINALPQNLNKNTPIAVKRFHARQLARQTGMSVEEAMREIEEQCDEFRLEETPETRAADEAAMEEIRRRGDERWNQRHNYVPVDHSKGIPGVDRPPGGGPPPPLANSDRRDRPRERKRGGVKERERKRRRDEMRGGGSWGRERDQWAPRDDYPPKYGRYEERRGYDDYPPRDHYSQEGTPAGYDRNYDDYYRGGHEGSASYEGYDRHHGQEDYDYYQGRHETEGTLATSSHPAESSYYQEDGSQYYNDYYGTSSGASEGGYHATFATPSAANSGQAPPPS